MERKETSREGKREIVVVKLEAKIEILRKWEVFTLVTILHLSKHRTWAEREIGSWSTWQ